MEDKLMRRAGLDYLAYASVQCHADWKTFLRVEAPNPERCFALTTRGQQPVHGCQFQAGDWLVFGSETSGLPADIRASFSDRHRMRLPMLPGQRSLNLSNAVAITVYEAWRQQGFAMPIGTP
ncbi:MAG: tRNA (uridine(34)/cytosine(34)/5-carboxymethylaminomethyluridine(34)-2'-O)-methyltransferase TrmL, partial [Betaproteobacteria bacterium]|nr:tRNA (uridine(34)/cytosine(34)/5-carboxymethylaminomethyluridine(34)-2'-O)-methyltransferase TrmL [Betaproteobacteria bacterium]